MDAKTKKMIAVVLVLLGLGAVGAVGFDYLQFLAAKNSGGMFSELNMWRWTSGKIFQIIAGFISIGTGVYMLHNTQKWWLTPIYIILFLSALTIIALILFSQSQDFAPFIYTLF